jgi:hypothetical protein
MTPLLQYHATRLRFLPQPHGLHVSQVIIRASNSHDSAFCTISLKTGDPISGEIRNLDQ